MGLSEYGTGCAVAVQGGLQWKRKGLLRAPLGRYGDE